MAFECGGIDLTFFACRYASSSPYDELQYFVQSSEVLKKIHFPFFQPHALNSSVVEGLYLSTTELFGSKWTRGKRPLRL